MTTAQTEARAIDALAEEMRTAMSCGICGHSRIDCECTHDEHRAFEAGIVTLTQENAELRQALATARREALEEALATIRPWKKRDHLSLHAGEVTAQEFRTVVAVLISIEGSLRALPLDIGGGDAG